MVHTPHVGMLPAGAAPCQSPQSSRCEPFAFRRCERRAGPWLPEGICAWRTIGSDRRQVDPSHVRASLLGPSPSQPHHPRPADARVRPSQAKVEQEVLAPQVLSRRLELRPWLPPRRSAHAPRRKLCPRHDKGQHGRCSCSTPPAGFVHCSRNGSRRARDIYLAQQGAHASNGSSRAAICARAVARRAHGG